MFQQYGTPAHQHATPSHSWSEREWERRDARNASSSGACVHVLRAHFEHEFWQLWAHLSWQLITLLNKPYLVYCANSVVIYFVAKNTFQHYVTIENICVLQGKTVTWVGVRRKIFIQHTILAILPSAYQHLLKLVEIWRSSDRNKNARFFETRCINAISPDERATRGYFWQPTWICYFVALSDTDGMFVHPSARHTLVNGNASKLMTTWIMRFWPSSGWGTLIFFTQNCVPLVTGENLWRRLQRRLRWSKPRKNADFLPINRSIAETITDRRILQRNCKSQCFRLISILITWDDLERS